MKKIIKRIAVMILAVVTVLAMSVPAFAATQERKNEKTSGGAELIGNTLVVNANDQQFFIYGTSVMAQFGGLADIIPNNGTGMIDVLFNGNVFKGVEELIIIRQKNKSEKVTLEEGSMIVTGIKTLEQLTTLKNVVAVNPKNLTELKNNMALNDVDLGATKNFIVTKDGISNENGQAVNSKSISGIAEIVTIKEIEEAEKEAKQTPAETPKSVEKESAPSTTPAPSVTPTPSPTPCTEHQYSDGEHNCVVCIKCGAKNPKACSGNHNWDTNNGQCRTCGYYCYHKFPAGMTGAACEICGYTPSVGPTPSAPPVCPHTYGYEDIGSDECHGCNGCTATFSHHYNTEGRCEDCGHVCTHGDATSGTCGYCGKNLGTPACLHGSYDYFNSTFHKCLNCEDLFTHEWVSGHCNICNSDCPYCNGDGTTDDIGCIICGKKSATPVTCQVDHSQYCTGWTCTCGEHGTGEHHYEEAGYYEHACTICQEDVRDHDYDTNGYCATCDYHCDHDGKITGICAICKKVLPIIGCAHTNGYILISATQHECKDCHEKFSHEWDDGYCTKCGQPCHRCLGTGKAGGCDNCGKDSSGCPDEANHPLVHNGRQCLTCLAYIGTAPHTWTPDTETPNRHGCTCGTYEPHHWTNKTGYCDECNAPCPSCFVNPYSIGAGKTCPTCGLEGTACPEDHSNYCEWWTCETCGESGTGAHHYSEGKCSSCVESCPTCHEDSDNYKAGERCPTCGLEGTACPEDHSNYCVGWTCERCRESGTGEHDYSLGRCSYCEEKCPECNGNPEDIGEGDFCLTCGLEGPELSDD